MVSGMSGWRPDRRGIARGFLVVEHVSPDRYVRRANSLDSYCELCGQRRAGCRCVSIICPGDSDYGHHVS